MEGVGGVGGGQLQEHRPSVPEAGGMGSVPPCPGEGVSGQWIEGPPAALTRAALL